MYLSIHTLPPLVPRCSQHTPHPHVHMHRPTLTLAHTPLLHPPPPHMLSPSPCISPAYCGLTPSLHCAYTATPLVLPPGCPEPARVKGSHHRHLAGPRQGARQGPERRSGAECGLQDGSGRGGAQLRHPGMLFRGRGEGVIAHLYCCCDAGVGVGVWWTRGSATTPPGWGIGCRACCWLCFAPCGVVWCGQVWGVQLSRCSTSNSSQIDAWHPLSVEGSRGASSSSMLVTCCPSISWSRSSNSPLLMLSAGAHPLLHADRVQAAARGQRQPHHVCA